MLLEAIKNLPGMGKMNGFGGMNKNKKVIFSVLSFVIPMGLVFLVWYSLNSWVHPIGGLEKILWIIVSAAFAIFELILALWLTFANIMVWFVFEMITDEETVTPLKETETVPISASDPEPKESNPEPARFNGGIVIHPTNEN